MANGNTAVITKAHLVYGVCLPLAVLLGYMLAEPFDIGNIAVVGIVLTILCVPLLMRWHHPLLIFACNALVCPYFLPGRPMLWMLATALSFTVLALNRALGRDVRLFQAPNVSRSLIFLVLVVLVTAYFNGGVGFAVLGNRTVGSKRYLTIIMAVLVYFSISCFPIKRRWAEWAVSAYCLSSLTALVSYVVAIGGPSLYFLVELFPAESAVSEVSSASGMDLVGSQIIRYSGLMFVSFGICSYLLAKYGARGVLDVGRPWRVLFLIAALMAGMLSGFRSAVILPLLLFAVMFYMEGLLRTRLFPSLVLVGILTCAVTLPFVQKMPFSVQRSLAFLPIDVDPLARDSAEASSDWRVQMWKELLPTIPKYLIKGKGLAMNQSELDMVAEGENLGLGGSFEASIAAGDYHNGPLSVLIPFGLFGAAGFVWFLYASLKVLRQNYLYGDPSLHRLNLFLLAFFVARIIFYMLVFGSFFSDLVFFCSLVGLSVSLNGGVCQRAEPELEPGWDDGRESP